MSKNNSIEKQFLIVCDLGPLIMTPDKEKAINSLKIARIKGHRGYLQEISANGERIKEIGKNLFKRKVSEDQRKNILNIRAKIIREYLDLKNDRDNDYTPEFVWKKVAKANNLTGFIDIDDFSQWTLDVREFNPHDNPKLLLDESFADGKNS
jgi:hypothetical protein